MSQPRRRVQTSITYSPDVVISLAIAVTLAKRNASRHRDCPPLVVVNPPPLPPRTMTSTGNKSMNSWFAPQPSVPSPKRATSSSKDSISCTILFLPQGTTWPKPLRYLIRPSASMSVRSRWSLPIAPQLDGRRRRRSSHVVPHPYHLIPPTPCDPDVPP
jgi:hypothetical protein